MLGQAINYLKSMPQDAAQRMAMFDQLRVQIEEATGGSWSANKQLIPGGGSVFSGKFGEALVIDPEGNLYRGNVTNSSINENFVGIPEFNVEGGDFIPIYENLTRL